MNMYQAVLSFEKVGEPWSSLIEWSRRLSSIATWHRWWMNVLFA